MDDDIVVELLFFESVKSLGWGKDFWVILFGVKVCCFLVVIFELVNDLFLFSILIFWSRCLDLII